MFLNFIYLVCCLFSVKKCETVFQTNGVVEYTKDRSLFSFVNYTCNNGYYLQGNHHRYCNHDHTGHIGWSGSVPDCAR